MYCSRRSWLSLILAMLFFALVGVKAATSYVRGYALPHKNLCLQMGLDLRLLILVASPLNNAAQRDAIRFSWGHYARSSHVAVAFVLGAPENNMFDVLAAEDALYGDIIIGYFDDSYPIFKMASMIDWTNAYCLNAPRIFITNDRVFTNVMSLLKLAEAPEYANAKLSVWGDFVSKNDIRAMDVYLFSNDTIVTLLPTVAKITSKHKVLLSAHKYHKITRHNVPNFINNLQQSCNVMFHVVCRIVFHYQHHDLWYESRNDTRNLYFRKDVNVVVSSRSMKPQINTGILILSLLFLLLCIF